MTTPADPSPTIPQGEGRTLAMPDEGATLVGGPRAVYDNMPKQIGPYRITGRLGAGGMGEVYAAEQEKPVRRKVALKLIRLGMDTGPIIARFESERQALAMMSHPAIARVYDGGATEQGLPYFVMEFVDGKEISEFCDQERMSTRQRLELFIDVCEGVQHAHQKGIIHRDIKPSNILIKREDGKITPKIIDFGIAKATSERLTESTYFTAAGQPIGTPEYMSPEQSGFGDADVDTRTDVYSLGVLLYELLVGARPFDVKELKLKGIDELFKHIREDDAPRASARITSLAATSATAALARKTDVHHLVRELKGDLDWILMRALEKDRNRRYSSVSEFAADIRRHLSNEPVLAGPPSKRYRLRKFVVRHKVGVTAAAFVALALLLGVTGTVVSLVRAVRAEKLAHFEALRANEQALIATQKAQLSKETLDFLVGLFSVVDPSESRGNTITVKEIFDKGTARIETELANQPETRATLLATIANVDYGLGLYSDAAALFEKSIAARRALGKGPDRELAKNLNDYGFLLIRLDKHDEAEPICREALDMRRTLFGEDHEDVAESINNLALRLYKSGDFAGADPLFRKALDMRRRLIDPESRPVADTLHNLGMNEAELGNSDSALALLQESLDMRKRLFGEIHPDVAESLNNLAFVLYGRGELDKAEPLFRQALDVQKKLVGEVHPEVAMAMNNLAFILHDTGNLATSEEIYRKVLDVQKQRLGDNHSDIAMVLENLAAVLHDEGNSAEAEKLAREALAMFRRVYGDEHPDIARCLNNLARWLFEKGDLPEAESTYRQALAMRVKLLTEKHPATAVTMTGLANLLVETRDYDEALQLATTARAILATSLAEDNWRTALADGIRGAALAGLKRYDEAEPLLIKSFQAIRNEKAAAAYAPETRRRLVALYLAQNKPDAAAPYRDPTTPPASDQ